MSDSLADFIHHARELVKGAPPAHVDSAGHYRALGEATWCLDQAAQILQEAKKKAGRK